MKGLVCSFSLDCAHGDLHLVGGELESEGRVEVCYKGGWYSVCGMDEQEASVMCKQLGHTVYPGKHTKKLTTDSLLQIMRI